MCLMEWLEFSWIEFYKTFFVVAFCLLLVQNKYKGMRVTEYEKLFYGINYVAYAQKNMPGQTQFTLGE